MWRSVIIIAFAVLPASAAEVMESSYTLPDGARVLRHEVLVPARPEAVYEAFTTSKGLMSFAAPLVSIDLRTGGVWESSYAPGAELGDPRNIRNEVLSYVPTEMLSIRITQTPPSFPNPDLAKKVFTVIQFVRINDPETTRVRISMLPYGTGSEWDRVYDLFRRGNALTLKRLHDHFAKTLERRSPAAAPQP